MIAARKEKIVVIADDFTGAAEIGGIGLRRGLKVLIETSVSGNTDVDLLVIATDTRSMNQEEASDVITKLTGQLLDLQPKFIFKKTDSVLRGNILSELLAQQQVIGSKRIILVPANPHFGRIITNGIYFIDGKPLAETSFANDPQYPAKSSDVKEILKLSGQEIHCFNANDILPAEGIIVGNVKNVADLNAWGNYFDKNTVFAGGSGFFDALLQKHFPAPSVQFPKTNVKNKMALFVYGSTFHKNGDSYLPENTIYLRPELFSDTLSVSLFSETTTEIIGSIKKENHVSLSTKNLDSELYSPELIRERTSILVSNLMKQTSIDELYIEGGATTYSILTKLGVSQLIPVREIEFGVIEMKSLAFPEMRLFTKPGSYSWPKQILKEKTK